MQTKRERYNQLLEQVQKCERCELYKKVKHRIVGAGNLDAEYLVIGEAPGVAEDNTGIPFASTNTILNSKCIDCKFFKSCYNNFLTRGTTKTNCTYEEALVVEKDENEKLARGINNAGGIFKKMINNSNIDMSNIYVTNVVSCRPVTPSGKNGKPTQEQVNACSGRLLKLIDIIKPKKIILVGSFPKTALTKFKTERMGEIVGTPFFLIINKKEYPAIIIYHPASLLYSGKDTADMYYNRNIESLNKLVDFKEKLL